MSVPDSAVYLTAAQVRARFGNCSDMWLWRRLHHDKFPQPVRFTDHPRARRMWKLSDIEAWESARIARAMPDNVVPLKRDTAS